MTAMTMTTSTTVNRQDYLKQLYVLQQRHRSSVPMGELASAMGVAPASATGMVKSLVDVGLVEHEPYQGVMLTENGERTALDVIRRHRLIEVFLVETLGLDWSEVHAEAEALEHAISDKLLERIDNYLDNPKVDPHGDPIPAAKGRLAATHRKSLAEYPAGEHIRIVRVMDQNADFLKFIDRIGLRPGVVAEVISNDEHAELVTVRTEDTSLINLSASAARKLLVDSLGDGD